MTVTLIIPAIPTRPEMLSQALSSVALQTRQPDEILVKIANDRMAAPEQRDHLLAKVETEWVACLDDDDWLYPNHLETLLEVGDRESADLVYPWFDVKGGTDPFPMFFDLPWSNDAPHQIPITALYRTSSVRALGGWGEGWDVADPDCPGTDDLGNRAGEDFALVKRMAAAGMKIVHVSERTWAWRHHASNSMGLPSKAFA